MKKLFISQPMNGISDEEILKEREKAIQIVKAELGEDVEVINSFLQSVPDDAKPLWLLGKSFELLSTADMAYFAKGWQDARGCKMEYDACVQYGIKTILSEFDAHKTAIGKMLDFQIKLKFIATKP